MEASGSARARFGALLSPLALVVVWLVPTGLDPTQQRLAAISAAVIVAWVTEAVPIPVTALMIAPAMVAAGITDAKTAFYPYADPLLFLFYGSFFIASAMGRHGLDRRIAHAIVSHPAIAGVPWRTRAALMLTGMLLSMWISNTASTAILMPILLGTFVLGGDSPEQKRALTGGLLAIAYACSIGGVGTLVGTPPNLIAVRLLKEAGVQLNFVDWAMIGLPTAVAIVSVIYMLFGRMYPPDEQARVDASTTAPEFGRITRGEIVTALCFVLAITGWVVPGVLNAVDSPVADAVGKALPSGAVAMLAASMLFIFKDGGGKHAVLPWEEARKIDWGLIMLFGGGISLGTQMFDTGLARELGKGFIALTGVTDVWTLTGVAILFTIFFTEVCSNTATANMVIPLVIGITAELGVSPVAPSIGVGLAASCAFMMPIATGPNAIVYGSGHVELPSMIRVGLILNVLCAVIVFALVRLLVPAYGWM